MSHANATNEDVRGRWQALARAAEAGDVRLVGELLAAGASADARPEGGATPLMRAAAGGFADVARALLDAGADVNARRGDGFTPLILAVFFGHEEVVRLLLARGADPAAETVLGVSARGWADARGFKVIGELLRQTRGTFVRPAPRPRATANDIARPGGEAAAVEGVLGKPGSGGGVSAARRAAGAVPAARVGPRAPAPPYEPRFETVDRGFAWSWQALVGVVLLAVACTVGGFAFWGQAGGPAAVETAPQPAAGAPQTAQPLPPPAAADPAAQLAPTPSTDPQGVALPPDQPGAVVIQPDPSAQPALIAPAAAGAASSSAPSAVPESSPEPTPTEPAPRREPRDTRREDAAPGEPAGRREDARRPGDDPRATPRGNPETQPSPQPSNPRPTPTPRRVIQWPP